MTPLIDILRALADPTRLRIVALVDQLELAVGEIADVLQQSQPRVSRHVRILVEAGLVERRREGSWVFLRIPGSAAAKAVRAFLGGYPLGPVERRLVQNDLAALARIKEERERAATAYFTAHAEEWDRIRSLHSADGEVEAAILKALHNRRLGHVLDIGTGTGRIAELLADRSERITGVDRSADMLRLARARLGEAAVSVDLVQGDFYRLPMGEQSAETVILHQVLHYAHEPDRVIAEAARVMKPGGHLLIVDFASHDREELRSQAAHARLGFSDGQMRGWFASSGLVLESNDALPGDPLTVRLWLARRRSDDPSSAQRAADPHLAIA